jgi:putative transferase (TIGR04331 family)
VINQSARYLITTDDERTWKFDRPVIFLGEWCRLYDRKHIWQSMDAIVAAPYGLGQAKKDADHAKARALEDELFPLLCATLNRHHDTEHGLRFWRIVLGHWFRRYVDAMLNRVNTLEQCLQTYQVSGTTGFKGDQYSLAALDSNTAIWAFNDGRWNNELNVRILRLLGEAGCPLELVAGCDATGFRWNALPEARTLKRKILSWGLQQIARFASNLYRNTDAFIISSYLPKIEGIKLQLALGQCPQLWGSPKPTISNNPNLVLRQRLTSQIVNNSENKLKRILSALVFELLPVCYLESFDAVKKVSQQHAWPKTPKFIFTSNNFDTDEIFKFWTATKTEMGLKYVVGQHGNYGVSRNHIDPSIEEETSDKFITWGWTDGLTQHTPAFILKIAGKKLGKYDKKGGLLLIEVCINHRITTWDGTAEFDEYFQEQQRFINALATSPRKLLTVRLHAGHRYANWSEEVRWQTFDPSLKIDTGGGVIKDLIAKSRIVIHSYDSTGILETLSLNIPTLVFWQNGFDHLRDSAKPYYKLLVDAGIVNLTPETAAHKVNDVWDDVDGWWRQSKVQDARKQFCDRYARVSRYPVRELKNILLK